MPGRGGGRSASKTPLQKIFSAQSFWVAVALLVLMLGMTALEPTFGTVGEPDQHFAQLRADRHHGARHDRGADHRRHRSVGRLGDGARRHRRRPVPDLALSLVRGLLDGHAAGLACGVFNGFFVAYVGMPSFVVTLGMLSIARSLAVVFSGNQMLYQFGPDAPDRQGDRPGQVAAACAGRLGARLAAGVLLAFLDADRADA